MKKFIARILLFSVVIFIIYTFLTIIEIFIIGPQYVHDYNASLIDKAARLKSINEPKIILVSGSNLAFGMNSPMLQEAMNMPVVNLGLHGGLGNAFHEDTAKLNINSGDIVVICHSNFSDDAHINDYSLAWITVEYHKDLWEVIDAKDYIGMLRAWPGYVIKNLSNWLYSSVRKKIGGIKISAYSRAAFNECGDVVFKPEDGIKSPDKIFTSEKVKLPEINEICVNRLNEFNRYIQSRGATMLIAGYPIARGKYSPPAEGYVKFQNELAEKLDCEIISDYRDYFFPYEYFYNSVLHLKPYAADIRTSQLIKDLKNWQSRHK